MSEKPAPVMRPEHMALTNEIGSLLLEEYHLAMSEKVFEDVLLAVTVTTDNEHRIVVIDAWERAAYRTYLCEVVGGDHEFVRMLDASMPDGFWAFIMTEKDGFLIGFNLKAMQQARNAASN